MRHFFSVPAMIKAEENGYVPHFILDYFLHFCNKCQKVKMSNFLGDHETRSCKIICFFLTFRTAEAAAVAPGTAATPTVQADNTTTLAAATEVETTAVATAAAAAAAVVSEELPSQVTVHPAAEVKTTDAPAVSTESSAVTESTAR